MNRRVMLGRVAGGTLAVMASATPALPAPVKLSVDTDVRLGYDVNPFLTVGSDVSSGYAGVTVSPKLSKQTEKGDLSLSGHYDRTEYFERYGHSDQYGAELGGRQRVTPKLTVFGALRYDSEVIGQGSATDDVTGPPIDDTDVDLIGLRRRSDTYQASGGWEYQISPTDLISADANYTDTRYGSGPPGADSKNMGGRFGWKHALNPRTSVGLSGSVYYIEYDTPGVNTLIMEPSVTFSTELSPTWHFDTQLGVSFSKLRQPLPIPDEEATGFSGNVNLCHKTDRDNFCLHAGRSVSASGSGGTVERTQVGVNYFRRLTSTLNWSGSASYARSESQTGLSTVREYLNARGGLDWKVAPWLTLGAEGRYRDVFGRVRGIRADYGGELNATISLPGRK